MKAIYETSQFRKDIKKLKKQGKDIQKLKCLVVWVQRQLEKLKAGDIEWAG